MNDDSSEQSDSDSAVEASWDSSSVGLDWDEIPEKSDVGECDASETNWKSKRDRVQIVIESMGPQEKLVLYALSKLVQDEKRPYRTTEIYEGYQLAAGDVQFNEVSVQFVHKILKKLSSADITKSRESDERGSHGGIYNKYELLHPPSFTISAVRDSDQRLQALETIETTD